MFSTHQIAHPTPDITTDVPLHSGMGPLDDLLGPQGLTRGHITEWVGAPGAGRTTLLGAMVDQLRAQGRSVVWIDAQGTLMADDWVDALPGVLWVIRPPKPSNAIFCAEMMLRAGCFDLVIIDEPRGLSPALGTRLQRLARQGGSALLLVRRGADEAVSSICRIELKQAEYTAGPLQPLSAMLSVYRTRGCAPQGPRRLLFSTSTPRDRLCSPLVPDRAGAEGVRS
ncbi:MAG: hypothetical protein ACE366_19835 [Bradymonadia bacterium]